MLKQGCATTVLLALVAFILLVPTHGEAGTIVAHVVLDGTYKASVAGKNADDLIRAQQSVVVSENQGLANVVVSLAGDLPAAASPSEAPVLDQREKNFVPHVLAVVRGQEVDFVNSDHLLHNVHVFEGEETLLNRAMPMQNQHLAFEAKGDDVLQVTCDVHRHMRAWIVLRDNPYFSVSRESGLLTLEDVPPGTYTLHAWHEIFGETETTVTVAEGDTPTPVLIRYHADSQAASALAGNPSEAQQPPALAGVLAALRQEKSLDQTTPWHPDYDSPEFAFRQLGVNQENYMRRERLRLREQILTFIPPLYQPAFVGHGYVLPPRTWRVTVSDTDFNIDPDDFFKNAHPDFVHENHRISRNQLAVNLFYGLDHDMTLRVEVPFWTSESMGSVHPAGVRNLDLFVEGTSTEMGDVSIFLKKKLWDQANRGFNFAAAVGVKLPTGSDEETFDQPMVVRDPTGALGVAFGGGPFPRFTDDGRLPASLQPGTGAMGYILGLFATRQINHFRGAIHGGVVAQFLDSHDGVDAGDRVLFFASFVKPVYKDFLSVELTVNGMDKDDDTYEGTFRHPIPDPVTGLLAGTAVTPRPSFQGGTIVFVSPSLILIPNPWLRITASALFRIHEPRLGPWPQQQLRVGSSITF